MSNETTYGLCKFHEVAGALGVPPRGRRLRIPRAAVVARMTWFVSRAGSEIRVGADGLAAIGCASRLMVARSRRRCYEFRGGVGSLAVGILAHLGYAVTAATGKTEERPFLESLGATEVIDRSAVDDDSGKPLLSGRWAGVVDSVGGSILATAIKSVANNAVVTCCGLVAAATGAGRPAARTFAVFSALRVARFRNAPQPFCCKSAASGCALIAAGTPRSGRARYLQRVRNQHLRYPAPYAFLYFLAVAESPGSCSSTPRCWDCGAGEPLAGRRMNE